MVLRYWPSWGWLYPAAVKTVVLLDLETGVDPLLFRVEVALQWLDVAEGVHKSWAAKELAPAEGVGTDADRLARVDLAHILVVAVLPHALVVVEGMPVAVAADTDGECTVAFVRGDPEHWDMDKVDPAALAWPGFRMDDASVLPVRGAAEESGRVGTAHTASGAQDAVDRAGVAFRRHEPQAFAPSGLLPPWPVAAQRLASFCDLLPRLLLALLEVPARLFLPCIQNRTSICNIVS